LNDKLIRPNSYISHVGWANCIKLDANSRTDCLSKIAEIGFDSKKVMTRSKSVTS